MCALGGGSRAARAWCSGVLPRGEAARAARTMAKFYSRTMEKFFVTVAYILPGPSIFSRIFSNIENIFVTQQLDEAKNRYKVQGVAPKPPEKKPQHFKDTYCIDSKLTVMGAKELFREGLVNAVVGVGCSIENIQEYFDSRPRKRSRG